MSPKSKKTQAAGGCRPVVDVEVRFQALQLAFELPSDLKVAQLREQLGMVTGIAAGDLIFAGSLSSAGDEEPLSEHAEESRLVVVIENTPPQEEEEEEPRERVDLDDFFPAVDEGAGEEEGEGELTGKDFVEAWTRAWDEEAEEELYDVYYSPSGEPISAAEANVCGAAPDEGSGVEGKRKEEADDGGVAQRLREEREREERTRLDEAIALSLQQQSMGAFDFSGASEFVEPAAESATGRSESDAVVPTPPPVEAPQLSMTDLEELLCEVGVNEAFLEAYEAQYGTVHPRFEVGSVHKAVRKARERLKPLLLYLHHADHVHTMPFCCGTLAGTGTSAFLDDHFVVWLGSIDPNFEGFFREALGVEEYPLLVVVGQTPGSSSMGVLRVLQGLLGPDELLVEAMKVLERFQPQIDAAHKSTRQQSEAELLREQQNDEFKRALAADRRQEERAEQQRLETLKAAEEVRNQATAAERTAAEALQRLPEEPAEGAQGVAALKVLFPKGGSVHRRFMATDKVQALYDFVVAEAKDEVADKAFVLQLSHPRKALEDMQQTLGSVGLSGRAVVRLQFK